MTRPLSSTFTPCCCVLISHLFGPACFDQEVILSVMVSHVFSLSRPSPASPSGKKFRSKPQLARYLGNQMDLSSFDFRTGKMLMSKLNKNRQRLRYDNNNQNKVRRTQLMPPVAPQLCPMTSRLLSQPLCVRGYLCVCWATLLPNVSELESNPSNVEERV